LIRAAARRPSSLSIEERQCSLPSPCHRLAKGSGGLVAVAAGIIPVVVIAVLPPEIAVLVAVLMA
jgi:hypothetical protein